jgi:hypothetical protein
MLQVKSQSEIPRSPYINDVLTVDLLCWRHLNGTTGGTCCDQLIALWPAGKSECKGQIRGSHARGSEGLYTSQRQAPGLAVDTIPSQFHPPLTLLLMSSSRLLHLSFPFSPSQPRRLHYPNNANGTSGFPQYACPKD